MVEGNVVLIKKRKIALDIFELEFAADNLPKIQCGQFVNLQIPCRPDLILKRPFGILDYDLAAKTFRVGITVVGSGTAALTKMKKGEVIKATYPLGNGFILNENHNKVVLLGGGTGIFPLFCVKKNYPKAKIYSFLGYKDKAHSFLTEEFKNISKEIFITTDNGTLGDKGFITAKLAEKLDRINPDIILACGPVNMLRALKKVVIDKNIEVKISVEERMGCGIGACLVCACKTSENGEIRNKKVCKDGPVFDLNEVIL